MGRIIGEHDQGDVRVTWRDDGDQIGIHYSQDIQPLIDRIAAQNAEGGAQVNEGIGWDPLESTCRHASLSIL